MTNEKQSRESTARRELAVSSKDISVAEIDFTDISTNQQSHRVRVTEELDAPSEILENVDTMRESPRHVPHIYRN